MGRITVPLHESEGIAVASIDIEAIARLRFHAHESPPRFPPAFRPNDREASVIHDPGRIRYQREFRDTVRVFFVAWA